MRAVTQRQNANFYLNTSALMFQISKLMPQGAGLASVLIKRASTVELDWDVRQKSRFDCTDSSGRSLGVFLPRGTVVRGGDVLVAEDGSLVRVIAAPQAVLKITHCTAHGSPFDLTRAAYHLGNRHVQIELRPDHLKIEPDHVLADMLRAMHLIVNEVTEAFEPESGAYASHGSHSHGSHSHASHAHDQSHDHEHTHAHEHSHAATPPKRIAIPIAAAPAHPQGHVHGPHCNHGHSH
jgi:urease accessory protein